MSYFSLDGSIIAVFFWLKMPIFQPKEDFKSLFESNSFSSIDGLRALSSLLIIYLHVSQLFVLFIATYPSAEWFNYLQTNAFLFGVIFVNIL